MSVIRVGFAQHEVANSTQHVVLPRKYTWFYNPTTLSNPPVQPYQDPYMNPAVSITILNCPHLCSFHSSHRVFRVPFKAIFPSRMSLLLTSNAAAIPRVVSLGPNQPPFMHERLQVQW
jgi:hypothetical protein